jgi:hypothetical protein
MLNPFHVEFLLKILIPYFISLFPMSLKYFVAEDPKTIRDYFIINKIEGEGSYSLILLNNDEISCF